MKKSIHFYQIILILFSISCSNEVETFSVLHTPELDYSDTYELKKGEKDLDITVPENCSIKYNFLQLANDSLLYCRTFAKPAEIHVYDIKNGTFVKRIFLDKGIKNINLNKLGSFALSKNQDIIVNRQGIFYVFSPTGKLDNVINCSDITYADSISNDNASMIAVPFSLYFGSEPIVLDSTKLLVSFQPPESFYIEGRDYFRAGIVDLKTKRCVKYLAMPTDNVYALMNKSAYTIDLSLSYKLLKGDTLFISYPMDHYIYGYNIKTGEQILKKPAFAREVTDFPPPLLKSDYSDRKTKWDFRVSSPFYEPLYYHSKVKMYTRIIHYPQSIKSPDGRLNNGEARTSAVIILDSSLNVVGETKFENAFLGIYKSFPTSDGLIFGSQKKYWEADDKLIYKNYYKIAKIQ